MKVPTGCKRKFQFPSGGQMKILISAMMLVLTTVSQSSYAELIPHIQINGKEELTVEPGKVVELRLSFTDSVTGQLVTKYRRMNNKFMHLVIMKEDLSSMVHLHPTLIGTTGQFWTVLNQQHEDPDTQGGEAAILKPGKYLVFAEVFPDRGAWRAAAQYIPFVLEAPGVVENKTLPLSVPNSQCEYVTFLKADGTTGLFGDLYKVSLHNEVVDGVNGSLVRFHFKVMSWSRRDQTYLPERNLQSFLGMHGHLFVTTTANEDLKDKLFVHSHGMIHPGLHDDHMIFSYFDRGALSKAPALRVWVQFKSNNRVQTADFTFKYDKHMAHMCHEH
jgi:hypothetical protein